MYSINTSTDRFSECCILYYTDSLNFSSIVHFPFQYDMAQIAALLHRAADMAHEPTTKEIKYLLPKPVLSLREPRPQQWSNMVQQAWNNVQHNTVAACKAQVLGECFNISWSFHIPSSDSLGCLN